MSVTTLPPGAALLLGGWRALGDVAAHGGSPGAAATALYLVGQGSVTLFLGSLAPNVGNFGAGAQGRVHGLLLSGFGGSRQGKRESGLGGPHTYTRTLSLRPGSPFCASTPVGPATRVSASRVPIPRCWTLRLYLGGEGALYWATVLISGAV